MEIEWAGEQADDIKTAILYLKLIFKSKQCVRFFRF